jgi:hypothetical protein
MTAKPTTIRLDPDTIAEINAWRTRHGRQYGDPSFSKAVRILVLKGLKGLRADKGE